VFLLTNSRLLAEPPIRDLIADYLAMNVPDRVTNVGWFLVLKRVEVDLAKDSKKEVFVGTWYRPDRTFGFGPRTGLWMVDTSGSHQSIPIC